MKQVSDSGEIDLVCRGVHLNPSLPQADLEFSAVTLNSSMELPKAWPLLKTFSAATSIFLWERWLSRDWEVSRPTRARPLGLLSYNGGITGSISLGLEARGSPRILVFN